MKCVLKPRLRARSAGLLLLILLLLAPGQFAFALVQKDSKSELDLVLLLDNSGSMRGEGVEIPSDREDNRLRFVPLLINYLKLEAETNEANYYLAMAGFGQTIVPQDTVPLTLVTDPTLTERVPSTGRGGTDFVVPLRFALNQFESRPATPGIRRAVLLVTDGMPKIEADELVEYCSSQKGLAGVLKELEDLGAAVTVLAFPIEQDKSASASCWKPRSGVDYRPISISELPVEYLAVARKLAGETRDVGIGDPGVAQFTLVLPPFQSQAMFTIIKEGRAALHLVSPTGQEEPASPSDVIQPLYEFRVVTAPAGGTWTITSDGGSLRSCDVETAPPTLRLTAEPTGPVVGESLTVRAMLLQAETPVTQPLKMRLYRQETPLPGLMEQDVAHPGEYRKQVPLEKQASIGFRVRAFGPDDKEIRAAGQALAIAVGPRPTPSPTITPIATPTPNVTTAPTAVMPEQAGMVGTMTAMAEIAADVTRLIGTATFTETTQPEVSLPSTPGSTTRPAFTSLVPEPGAAVIVRGDEGRLSFWWGFLGGGLLVLLVAAATLLSFYRHGGYVRDAIRRQVDDRRVLVGVSQERQRALTVAKSDPDRAETSLRSAVDKLAALAERQAELYAKQIADITTELFAIRAGDPQKQLNLMVDLSVHPSEVVRMGLVYALRTGRWRRSRDLLVRDLFGLANNGGNLEILRYVSLGPRDQIGHICNAFYEMACGPQDLSTLHNNTLAFLNALPRERQCRD